MRPNPRQLALDLAMGKLGCDACINASTQDTAVELLRLCSGGDAKTPLDGPDVVFDCAAGALTLALTACLPACLTH